MNKTNEIDITPNKERETKEILIDRLLLLYLINSLKKWSETLGITQIQKNIFISECQMIINKVKGLNYYFFKGHYGPLSVQIYGDINTLEENGIIKGFNLEKGKRMLRDCNELFVENREILDYIDSTVDKYHSAYKRGAYSYKVRGEKIIDIEYGTPLIRKIKKANAEKQFKISDEWIETLEIYLDLEADESLTKSLRRAREEVARPYEGIS